MQHILQSMFIYTLLGHYLIYSFFAFFFSGQIWPKTGQQVVVHYTGKEFFGTLYFEVTKFSLFWQIMKVFMHALQPSIRCFAIDFSFDQIAFAVNELLSSEALYVHFMFLERYR